MPALDSLSHAPGIMPVLPVQAKSEILHFVQNDGEGEKGRSEPVFRRWFLARPPWLRGLSLGVMRVTRMVVERLCRIHSLRTGSLLFPHFWHHLFHSFRFLHWVWPGWDLSACRSSPSRTSPCL